MKNIKYIIFIMIFCTMNSFSYAENNPSFGTQSSSKNIEWGFDMVETFDNVADWPVSSGNASNIGRGINGPTSKPYLPKSTSGSTTPINHYAWWKTTQPTVDWIQDHRKREGKIWDPLNTGKGKSVCITYGSANGPSHFGWYFGGANGRNGGYDDEFYVFFMYYIPKSMYPTYENSSGVGSYVDGDPYIFNPSFKFSTVALGFGDISRHSDSETYDMGSARMTTYGWAACVFHIKPASAGYMPRGAVEGKPYYSFATPVPPFASEQDTATKTTYNVIGNYIEVGKWKGIEFRYKKNTGNNEDGIFQAWDYDPATGESTEIVSKKDLWYICGSLNSDKFNFYFIGGNNSSSWTWGSSMDPNFYIDDVIINATRIGPRYFSDVLGVSSCGSVSDMDNVSVKNQ